MKGYQPEIQKCRLRGSGARRRESQVLALVWGEVVAEKEEEKEKDQQEAVAVSSLG